MRCGRRLPTRARAPTQRPPGAGATIDRIVRIEEEGDHVEPPRPMMRMAAQALAALTRHAGRAVDDRDSGARDADGVAALRKRGREFSDAAKLPTFFGDDRRRHGARAARAHAARSGAGADHQEVRRVRHQDRPRERHLLRPRRSHRVAAAVDARGGDDLRTAARAAARTAGRRRRKPCCRCRTTRCAASA